MKKAEQNNENVPKPFNESFASHKNSQGLEKCKMGQWAQNSANQSLMSTAAAQVQL